MKKNANTISQPLKQLNFLIWIYINANKYSSQLLVWWPHVCHKVLQCILVGYSAIYYSVTSTNIIIQVNRKTFHKCLGV